MRCSRSLAQTRGQNTNTSAPGLFKSKLIIHWKGFSSLLIFKVSSGELKESFLCLLFYKPNWQGFIFWRSHRAKRVSRGKAKQSSWMIFSVFTSQLTPTLTSVQLTSLVQGCFSSPFFFISQHHFILTRLNFVALLSRQLMLWMGFLFESERVPRVLPWVDLEGAYWNTRLNLQTLSTLSSFTY